MSIRCSSTVNQIKQDRCCYPIHSNAAAGSYAAATATCRLPLRCRDAAAPAAEVVHEASHRACGALSRCLGQPHLQQRRGRGEEASTCEGGK